MDILKRILATQPALFTGIIASVGALLVSLGVTSQAHVDASVTIAGAILSFALPLLASIITHQSVYSQKSVDQIVSNLSPDSALAPAPLTAADAAADLAGTPRPDNPTVPPAP